MSSRSGVRDPRATGDINSLPPPRTAPMIPPPPDPDLELRGWIEIAASGGKGDERGLRVLLAARIRRRQIPPHLMEQEHVRMVALFEKNRRSQPPLAATVQTVPPLESAPHIGTGVDDKLGSLGEGGIILQPTIGVFPPPPDPALVMDRARQAATTIQRGYLRHVFLRKIVATIHGFIRKLSLAHTSTHDRTTALAWYRDSTVPMIEAKLRRAKDRHHLATCKFLLRVHVGRAIRQNTSASAIQHCFQRAMIKGERGSAILIDKASHNIHIGILGEGGII